MPRVVTASLLALVLYPHLLPAQGTRLWVQSRYEEFEKGQPDSAAIASRGYLEAGPALQSVLLTPSTYIWAVASDSQGNAYVGTGSPATVLKVSPAGVSTKLFTTKDLTVQAIRVGPDGSVYAATVPGGKVYRIRPGQSGLDESNATLVFDAATIARNPVRPRPNRLTTSGIWRLTHRACSTSRPEDRLLSTGSIHRPPPRIPSSFLRAMSSTFAACCSSPMEI